MNLPQPPNPRVVVVCTGNAARSVIAGQLLVRSGLPLEVVSAGTHVIEHQPMSVRTRAAMLAIGLDPLPHRSRQLTAEDAAGATLVMAMAPEHIRYVRRHHPEASARTATLPLLVERLAGGDGPLAERVAALGLAQVGVDAQGEVEDPAGRDEAAYVECAVRLADLVGQIEGRLA